MRLRRRHRYSVSRHHLQTPVNFWQTLDESTVEYIRRVMQRLAYTTVESASPAGALLLAASERGLAILSFHPEEALTHSKAEFVRNDAAVAPYAKELQEYLAGKRRDFDMPLDLQGTDFQLRCWNQLLKIPYGDVITYAELARRVQSPNGFRAVGHANGQNPIAIIVPCHRVIASDGTLGGYGGGLPMKQWLLDLEKALIPAQRQMSVFA
jgi:methylated-DNA-[protein]-cysteine S-methyltransferase